jgi:hypothetical protein
MMMFKILHCAHCALTARVQIQILHSQNKQTYLALHSLYKEIIKF